MEGQIVRSIQQCKDILCGAQFEHFGYRSWVLKDRPAALRVDDLCTIELGFDLCCGNLFDAWM
jgi:hypothetical protein